MLAYDHAPSHHPWASQLPDVTPDYASLAGLDSGYGLAGLSQAAQGASSSMDALQSMLLGTQGTPDLSQLLAQLPPPGLGGQLPGMSPTVSSPLQFQGAADAAWAHSSLQPQDQHQAAVNPRVFVPDSLKGPGSASPTSSSPDQQLLLQAALGQMGPAAMPSPADTAGLLPQLLQEQLLLQALQQQQAAAAASAAAQPNMQAALAAALSAQANAAAALQPPGLAHQALGGPLASALAAANPSAGNLWPFMPPAAVPGATAAAAATAAALLAAQQQQHPALNPGLAPPGLAGGMDTALLQQLLLSQGHPAAAAGAGVTNQLQPWAVKALVAQLQQGAHMNVAAFNQQQLALANLLGSPAATAGTGPAHPKHIAGQAAAQVRRGRNGRRSSGTAAAADLAGSLGGFTAASRSGSITGSEAAAADGKGTGIPAVLPAGVTAQDLCPSKYEDTWAADGCCEDSTTAVAPVVAGSVSSSDGSCQLARGCSSASTSSIDSSVSSDGAASLCGSALSLSSSGRQGSDVSADDKWQWESSMGPIDDDAGAPAAQGKKGGAAAPAAAADDTEASKDQGPTDRKAAMAAAAAGCPVWVPGQRQAAGDDSWYLPRPRTCRLFVGNIGCWVDESMLLAYFGKYGHVVDVQVMWNTKMLARGRRVNREFAFISYSSPLEAARAVHWLDGCRLPDLEKDKNGVTVEYENGEGDSTSPGQ